MSETFPTKREVGTISLEKKTLLPEQQTTQMNRSLSAVDGAVIVFGIMIGTGIFASPGSVLSSVQSSIGLSLLIWIGGGVLSLLGGLCFAELGAALPTSGGDYVYLSEGLHPGFGFLFVWACFFCLKTGSQAIIATVFAQYFSSAVLQEDQLNLENDYRVKLFAMGAIILLSILNLFGVTWASRAQRVFVIFKCMAVLMVFTFAGVGLGTHETTEVAKENFTNMFNNDSVDWSIFDLFTSIGIGTVSALWAYDGFSNLNAVAEEVKNPTRNIPLAILTAVLGVTLTYVAINIAYFCVLTPDQITSSSAVAILMAEQVAGKGAEITISLLVSMSAFGSLNGSILTSARIFYAAGKAGQFPFPNQISRLSRFQVPYVAILVQMIVSVVLVIPGNFQSLVNYFGFAQWIFNGLVVVGLIRLRWTRKSLEKPFKVKPFPWIPIIFIITSFCIVLSALVEDLIPSLFALGFLVLGVPLYLCFFWRGNCLAKLFNCNSSSTHQFEYTTDIGESTSIDVDV